MGWVTRERNGAFGALLQPLPRAALGELLALGWILGLIQKGTISRCLFFFFFFFSLSRRQILSRAHGPGRDRLSLSLLSKDGDGMWCSYPWLTATKACVAEPLHSWLSSIHLLPLAAIKQELFLGAETGGWLWGCSVHWKHSGVNKGACFCAVVFSRPRRLVLSGQNTCGIFKMGSQMSWASPCFLKVSGKLRRQ